MRKLLVALGLSIFTTCTAADSLIQSNTLPDMGTSHSLSTTGQLEVAYLTVHALDWMQTLTIAKNPDRWHETNPILGRHPSVSEVNQYFLATAVAHALISHYLPKRHARLWQGATIVMQMGFVGHNQQLGIGLNVNY